VCSSDLNVLDTRVKLYINKRDMFSISAATQLYDL